MKTKQLLLSLPLFVFYLTMVSTAYAAGVVTGKVTAEDQTMETESVNAASVMNAGNAIQFRNANGAGPAQNGAVPNVVVYVSSASSARVPSERQPISIAQDSCHFTDAILRMGFVPLAPYTGQAINTADEEIIPVKCDVGTGMRKYFVVLKTAHFFVTGENGTFTLNHLAPGKYTITAWDESFGSQSQEVTISGSETAQANFVFRPKSKT